MMGISTADHPDVKSECGTRGKGAEELLGELRVERRTAERRRISWQPDLVGEVRASGKIQCDLYQCLVQRQARSTRTS